MSDIIIAGLVAALICERIWSTITINRLVNKLMSRDYHEYVLSKKEDKSSVKQEFKIPTEPVEDLGVLSGIG